MANRERLVLFIVVAKVIVTFSMLLFFSSGNIVKNDLGEVAVSRASKVELSLPKDTTILKPSSVVVSPMQRPLLSVLRSGPLVLLVASMVCTVLVAAWYTGLVNLSSKIMTDPEPFPDPDIEEVPIPEVLPEETVYTRLFRWYQEKCLCKFSSYGILFLLIWSSLFLFSSLHFIATEKPTLAAFNPYIAFVSYLIAMVCAEGYHISTGLSYIVAILSASVIQVIIAIFRLLITRVATQDLSVHIQVSVFMACCFFAVGNVFWVLLFFSVIAAAIANNK